MMTSYMAIWYHCNQKCTGCPCAMNVDRTKSMSIEDVQKHMEELVESNKKQEPIFVTISGGEPTLHPDFFQILDIFKRNDVFLTILSNGEKFGDPEFCDMFLNHCNILRTHVVTTIHSSNPEIHEKQNGSVGSFERSIRGLQYLHLRGICVTVKHCITGINVEDTLSFIKMVDTKFHPSVNIELWGLDYCGLTKEQAQTLFMPYRDMRPWIEQALDYCIEANARNGRKTMLCNIPLCAVDPFYWFMFRRGTKQAVYSVYFDPQHTTLNLEDDSGTLSDECIRCAVRDVCEGTYRSMFTYFGNDTVKAVSCYQKGGKVE